MTLSVPIPAGTYSIDIVPTEWTAPGEAFYFDRAIYAHPLDTIAFRYPDDPLARLDAAMSWLLKRTLRRLAQLERAL